MAKYTFVKKIAIQIFKNFVILKRGSLWQAK